MFEIAIGLGVLMSLFFLETFGAAAGGIVVAGYVAMYLHQPITILATLSISVLVYLIVKILGKFMFIYGRRRMVVTVLLGFIIGWAARYYGVFANISANYSVNVIGFIIPGLIANAMEKQGILRTISIMTLAAVIVRLLLVLIFGGQLIE
ncbi:MAG: poly-gamma-glutamate biosynthesis protein PgsC [Candidatus Cloacimonetes bacterium]|nr:poly-gamma-glutamate biosynthesis protein PgsC [Candidatus Cloacimonadota bacterium]MCF7813672.1 poly-gamma-glutamate biosynthesis protein PgsC [Candidatus Cloacimonadota bacterium]MCF7867172.1 poly-gamma-glutamate biosynthesis protein PgsC [Candidatus Cloacimonadota bacterium]MCF7882508.1 poly-gamma-glutamate biosynthesis protein PgsC [Candidatus Cloacimonadota bacterium]